MKMFMNLCTIRAGRWLCNYVKDLSTRFMKQQKSYGSKCAINITVLRNIFAVQNNGKVSTTILNKAASGKYLQC